MHIALFFYEDFTKQHGKLILAGSLVRLPAPVASLKSAVKQTCHLQLSDFSFKAVSPSEEEFEVLLLFSLHYFFFFFF